MDIEYRICLHNQDRKCGYRICLHNQVENMGIKVLANTTQIENMDIEYAYTIKIEIWIQNMLTQSRQKMQIQNMLTQSSRKYGYKSTCKHNLDRKCGYRICLHIKIENMGIKVLAYTTQIENMDIEYAYINQVENIGRKLLANTTQIENMDMKNAYTNQVENMGNKSTC